MRCEQTIAVLVLAAGMMMASASSAEAPAAATPEKDSSPTRPSVSKPLTSPRTVPWKQAELGPEHAILAALNGHWLATVQLADDPRARPKDTQGTADGKALMNGLFTQLSHVHKRKRQPFEGMMIYGYNAAIGKYTGDWIDTSSPGIVHYLGTYDAEKKLITMTAHYSDPLTRRLTISRVVTAFVDANTVVYEEWHSGGVGEPETPIVSITLKRG